MGNQKKIIINADDLGFSQAVNAAILCCAEHGTVTAASVMVNMPFADDALRQVQERVPQLSLALHFTLTSGKPVSSPLDVPLLVDSNGLFRLGFLGLWKALMVSKEKSKLLQQLHTEFLAQMNRMSQLCEKYHLRFDHLDSHQHVHVLPGIWKLLQQEAEQRRLSLRVPREHWGTLSRSRHRGWTWFPQGLLKQAILNGCLRKVPQKTGYFGILETGRMDESALHWIIHSVGTSSAFDTYEINTHPSVLSEASNHAGLCCSEADEQFHTSPWREREFRALNCRDVFSWAKQYSVVLGGF